MVSVNQLFKSLALFLLLVLALPALAGPPEPPRGTYKFTQEHTVKVATKYAGGRGINPDPVEWSERTYKPGETIQVDEFFWISEESVEAKLVYKGTNLSVPLGKLKRVK